MFGFDFHTYPIDMMVSNGNPRFVGMPCLRISNNLLEDNLTSPVNSNIDQGYIRVMTEPVGFNRNVLDSKLYKSTNDFNELCDH
jgi:hypothetical protein